MTKTENVILFLLLILTLSAGLIADTGKTTVRAIEFFGINKQDESRYLKMIDYKIDQVVDYKKFIDDMNLVKGKIESESNIVKVITSPIRVKSVHGDFKSGLYFTFDIVTNFNSSYKSLNPVPNGKIVLKPEMVKLYAKYEEATYKAEDKGIYEEDYLGFYYYKDQNVKKIIKVLKSEATKGFLHLKDVIGNSKNVSHRALASTLIGASEDKPRAVKVLLSALRDPSGWVRNNAARVLIPIVKHGKKTGSYSVPVEPFLEMVQLPTVSDRNKAVANIVHLNDQSKEYRKKIMGVIGDLLEKMARSKQPNNFMYAKPLLKKFKEMSKN